MTGASSAAPLARHSFTTRSRVARANLRLVAMVSPRLLVARSAIAFAAQLRALARVAEEAASRAARVPVRTFVRVVVCHQSWRPHPSRVRARTI